MKLEVWNIRDKFGGVILKTWTIVFVNCKNYFNVESEYVEILVTDLNNFFDTVSKATGKYISFIFNDDTVSSNYVDILLNKSFEEFDCCFINYSENIKLEKENVINTNPEYLITLKPYGYEYLWSYLFKTEIFRKILSFGINENFNSNIDDIVLNMSCVEDIVYYHNNLDDLVLIDNCPYSFNRRTEYYKNVFYVNDSLSGSFSGIITWLKNIGILFGKDYELTILFDVGYEGTVNDMSKYYKLVARDKGVNYICDSFITTYLTYNYPKNIFYNKMSTCFIHGIMTEDDCLFPDLYDRYIAVSETCAKSVKYGFLTDKPVEFIHNPVVVDKSIIKPHLKLVSTTRIESIKGLERSKKLAAILEEEGIPFTWNVFTEDYYSEGRNLVNSNGFIYRKAVGDVLSYINDSDYLVLLSDSESFCYSVLESLIINKKVVVTPCDVYKEIGVVEGENAIMIPFEYFDDSNKEKLREKALEIYNEKNKEIKYDLVKLNSDKFIELFYK